ncbi:MAG: hypothetical protein LBT79_05385 [Elusimicrobiota bacterium]|jgi:glutamyl-tRNA reductase|nr:hypothetical protein [Elusimicrobiota bacterium]
MEALKISPNFTIDDIHKIREYNYELRKNMTFEQYRKDLEKGVNEFHQYMSQLKAKNKQNNQ